MSYHLILVLVLHQELRYLYFYYQYTEISHVIDNDIFIMLPSGNKNSERESNPMSLPLYLYLSRSLFFVSFADPNKQLPNVKSVFKFLNCGFSV